MKAKRPFGAQVCLAPNSGVKADIPGPSLWAITGSGQRYSIMSSARAEFPRLRPGPIQWQRLQSERHWLNAAHAPGIYRRPHRRDFGEARQTSPSQRLRPAGVTTRITEAANLLSERLPL